MHCTVKLEQIRAKKYEAKKLNLLDHELEGSAPETTADVLHLLPELCLAYNETFIKNKVPILDTVTGLDYSPCVKGSISHWSLFAGYLVKQTSL